MVEIDENTVVLGPGAQLKDKRESLSIPIEQMAEKLRLDLVMLKKIEADEYDKATPPAFIRGYLRNYAKEVGLDGNHVVSIFNGFLEAADDVQLSAIGSSNRRLIDKKRYRYGRWLIALVVIAIVALVVVYLGKFLGNLFDKSTQAPQEIALSTDGQTSGIQLSIDETATSATSSQDIDKPATRNNKERTSMPINTQKHPEALQLHPETEEMQPQVPTSESSNANLISVRISLVDEAWFEVRNANDEIIATGIKEAGFNGTYQVEAPLFVNIGKPENATLIIDGNAIDLSGYRPSQPAKINYPE